MPIRLLTMFTLAVSFRAYMTGVTWESVAAPVSST